MIIRIFLIALMTVVVSGCDNKSLEGFTIGWGPVGKDGYELVASEFDKHSKPVGEPIECDEQCLKLWKVFGMDVAMGDLVKRNSSKRGYEYRKVK